MKTFNGYEIIDLINTHPDFIIKKFLKWLLIFYLL